MTAMSAQSASTDTNPFPDLPAIRGTHASPKSLRPRGPAPRSYPRPRFGDFSRTRFESRVAFGGPDENEARPRRMVATPTRQFSLLEITSGLPDDSREADERAAERTLRDLRGRVKAARAVIATTPGARGDPPRATGGRRRGSTCDSGLQKGSSGRESRQGQLARNERPRGEIRRNSFLLLVRVNKHSCASLIPAKPRGCRPRVNNRSGSPNSHGPF